MQFFFLVYNKTKRKTIGLDWTGSDSYSIVALAEGQKRGEMKRKGREKSRKIGVEKVEKERKRSRNGRKKRRNVEPERHLHPQANRQVRSKSNQISLNSLLKVFLSDRKEWQILSVKLLLFTGLRCVPPYDTHRIALQCTTQHCTALQST